MYPSTMLGKEGEQPERRPRMMLVDWWWRRATASRRSE